MLMLVKEEAFQKLCPSYQKAFLKLENENATLPEDDFVGKIRLFKNFIGQYVVLPEIIDELLRLSRSATFEIRYSERVEYPDIRKIMEHHFYHHHRIIKKLLHEIPQWVHSKLILFDYRLGILEYEKYYDINPKIFLPYFGMERTFRMIDKFSCYPLPNDVIRKYQDARKLYDKILENENDPKEWIALLNEVDDEEFLINNIDYKLGKDLNNIPLWHAYIEFLKSYNTKKLLQLYSRYCRYFVNDLNMKIEYKKAVQQFGPSIVHWENLFPFETSGPVKGTYYHEPLEERFPMTKPALSYSIQGYVPQIFSLPKPLISYIQEPKTPAVLHKLHKTCKYFFFKQPYPICHRLEILFGRVCLITFLKQYIEIYVTHGTLYSDISYSNKLIISNNFDVNPQAENQLSRNVVSQTIKHIFLCRAKFICIHYQDISENEFKFLVGHGNVEVLHLKDVKILKEENSENSILLEELLKFVPKIKEFKIYSPTITLQTFENLATLKFVYKFEEFHIDDLTCLEPYGFIEFIKKNFDSNTRFSGRILLDLRNKYSIAIQFVNNEVKHWPKEKKPYEFQLY